MACSPKYLWSVYHSLFPNRQRIPHLLSNGPTTAESPTSKANLLNTYFASCFSPLSAESSSCMFRVSDPAINLCMLQDCQISRALLRRSSNYCPRTIKVKTASGPDGLSSHMLRNTASSTCSSLTNSFQQIPLYRGFPF